jgi:hypothetical protein
MRKEPGSVYDKWTYPWSFVIIPDKRRAHLNIYLLFIGLYISYISWVMYWSGYTCRILAGWCPLYTLYVTLSKYNDI